MDSRTAAGALSQIAAFLELRGENKFKVRAYEQAAQAVVALDGDDLGALDRSGQLAATKGLGAATLAVVRDLIDTGESAYLEKLRADTPPGLLELLAVPGLGNSKIQLLHRDLGVDSADSLEAAIRSGRLTTLKGFGPKTAEKLLRGLELYRASARRVLYPRGLLIAQTLANGISQHPDVERAEIAGSVRRTLETVGDADIVVLSRSDPVVVAASFANGPGVTRVVRENTSSPRITYADGTCVDLYCVGREAFPLALWRATGSADHVTLLTRLLAERGYVLHDDGIVDKTGQRVDVPDEESLYELAGIAYVPPEMRERGDEITLAIADRMPRLVELSDIRGTLHCHSTYSDGKQTIAEMSAAARERGWSYIGITDHSEAAFFAGGMTRENVSAQHAEIDALNASQQDFRILKGIEADILAEGDIDYDDVTLARFDFVIGSIHSRFTMDRTTMTARVLRALENPRLTILGHPTGRLLLSRHAYPLDVDAVLVRAAELGVAIELNADPKRLDLDWRHLARAKELGVLIEIGSDSHSTKSLDYMQLGVGIARKGGLEASDILNTRSADDVLAFARRSHG